MIDAILEGLISGIIADRLARLVRPKKSSIFDDMTFEQLRARNNRINAVAKAILWGSFFAGFLAMVTLHVPHNGWTVGFFFCAPVTLMFVFVSAVTLPRGVRRFREFWRFHEIKYRTRLAMLLSAYVPLALIGAVSAYHLLIVGG